MIIESVTWYDAAKKEDYHPQLHKGDTELHPSYSVGIVIHETDEVLLLAQTHHSEVDWYRDVIAIPRAVIIKRIRLIEKEEVMKMEPRTMEPLIADMRSWVKSLQPLAKTAEREKWSSLQYGITVMLYAEYCKQLEVSSGLVRAKRFGECLYRELKGEISQSESIKLLGCTPAEYSEQKVLLKKALSFSDA